MCAKRRRTYEDARICGGGFRAARAALSLTLAVAVALGGVPVAALEKVVSPGAEQATAEEIGSQADPGIFGDGSLAEGDVAVEVSVEDGVGGYTSEWGTSEERPTVEDSLEESEELDAPVEEVTEPTAQPAEMVQDFVPLDDGVEGLTPEELMATVEGENGATPLDVHAASIHDANEAFNVQVQASARLPESYTSQNVDGRSLVTTIKNQEPFGVCWAFSTIGALESSLLAHNAQLDAGSLDLSERHLAYFTYHQQDDALGNIAGDSTTPLGAAYSYDRLGADPYLISGGNYYVASMALASWAGAAR